MIPHYIPVLIDQMITERAIAYQAERMGFRVTDEDVANAIRSMLPQMLGSGEFDPKLYAAYMQQQGLTIPEFERNIKNNLYLLKLQNIALEGAIVTPSEVESEYHRKNDKVKVEYVAWTPKDLRSQVTVDAGRSEGVLRAEPARSSSRRRSDPSICLSRTKPRSAPASMSVRRICGQRTTRTSTDTARRRA